MSKGTFAVTFVPPTGLYYRDSMRAAVAAVPEKALSAAHYMLRRSLADHERAVQQLRAAAPGEAYDRAHYYHFLCRWSIQCEIAHIRQLVRCAGQ